MFKVAFIILRVLIAIGAVMVLAGTTLVFLVENFVGLIKGLGKLAVGLVTLFASGFQKSSDVPEPSLAVSPALAAIAITYLSILVSVFLPGQKIFLHAVAAMSLAVAVWDIWRAATTPNTEALLWPVILLWFVYYGICLRRA